MTVLVTKTLQKLDLRPTEWEIGNRGKRENSRRLGEEGTEVARGTEETEGRGKQMEQEEQTDRGSNGEERENHRE